MYNESGVLVAVLAHVVSCDIASALVLGMQHAHSAQHMSSHNVVLTAHATITPCACGPHCTCHHTMWSSLYMPSSCNVVLSAHATITPCAHGLHCTCHHHTMWPSHTMSKMLQLRFMTIMLWTAVFLLSIHRSGLRRKGLFWLTV